METKLERISQMSREHPEMAFTSIGHLINAELLKECHEGMDGRKAVGMQKGTHAMLELLDAAKKAAVPAKYVSLRQLVFFPEHTACLPSSSGKCLYRYAKFLFDPVEGKGFHIFSIQDRRCQ